jgi:hypothetical protein
VDVNVKDDEFDETALTGVGNREETDPTKLIKEKNAE